MNNLLRKIVGNNGSVQWMSDAAGKKKWGIALLSVFQIVLGVSAIWFALLLRDMIDSAVAADRAGLMKSSFGLVFVVVLQVTLRLFGRYLEELYRASLENKFKERLFSVLMEKDYAAITAVHSGEWMNRLTSDTVVVADGLVQILPSAIGMLVKMVGGILMIIILLPWLGLALIPAGLVMLLFTQGFRKRMKRLHKDIQEKDGKLRVFLQERLGSMLMVRAYAKEQDTLEEASGKMSEHKDARKKRSLFYVICNAGFSGSMNAIYVIGAIYCCIGIMQGTISYGTLMTVLQLINQVQSPMANISGFVPRYYAMLASAERLMEVESFPEDCLEEKKSLSEVLAFYENEFAGIGLSRAEFTYLPPVREPEVGSWDTAKQSMPVVFKNVNLEIKKGDYVAITGQSGSGKSTVLKLIMCLYLLDEGERYLLCDKHSRYLLDVDCAVKVSDADDGKNVSDIADEQTMHIPLTRVWQKLFAYVPQGNQLMSGPIREVIAFGDKEKMNDEVRLRRAIEIACADEFIDKLEDQLDTVLGERGMGLSEGQMQRIAIARAVFSEHPILILDEATSALDDATENRLLQNLQSMTDKTVLIVTHRPAALAICNRHIQVSESGISLVKNEENERII